METHDRRRTLWLRCDDPEELIDYHSMKSDKRRLRLLAIACVRRVLARKLPKDADAERELTDNSTTTKIDESINQFNAASKNFTDGLNQQIRATLQPASNTP